MEPQYAERSLAKIDLSADAKAHVSLGASIKAGIPTPIRKPTVSIEELAAAGDADAHLAAQFKMPGLVYEISRPCSDCAILADGLVRWRLDRPEAPPLVRLDAANLSAVVAVAPDSGPVDVYAAARGWSRADLVGRGPRLALPAFESAVRRLVRGPSADGVP